MKLNDQSVRASLLLSKKFTLLMVSSSGFGSYLYYYNFALLTLGFPMTPPLRGLVSSTDKLVGSFFNRHAITDNALRAMSSVFSF